jgi:hypothetical protein
MWDNISNILRDTLPDQEIDEVRLVERGEDRPLVDINKKDNLLKLNLDALDRTEREEIVGEIGDTFRSQHRLFTGDTNSLREATHEAISEEYIRKSIDSFSNYISGSYLNIVERSLVINKMWQMLRFPPDIMDTHKNSIAEDFVEQTVGATYDGAYNAIHMASSGYFSHDGYVLDTFSRISDSSDDTHIDYHNIFNKIISNSPFLVTVGRNNPKKVAKELVSKLESADRYRFPVEFVDARGQGGSNRATLEEAILNLQRDAEELEYECTVIPGETIYRLYPQSLEGKFSYQ